jgi:hypothetical protein
MRSNEEPTRNGSATSPARRGRLCDLVRRLALLGCTFLAFLAGLELLLAVAPRIFGQQRCNRVFSRYDSRAGGIYAREPLSRVPFMRPDFVTRNYWNDYRWNHATDSRGFRNPPGTPADVLLLGDSMIYGHGVEEDETVAHFLRLDHRVGAYNMGRQGAALYDEYVYLRTFLPELSPKAIVLFVFLNDFDDLEVYRSTAEIIEAPEIDRLNYDAVRAWIRELPAHRPTRIAQWFWRRPSLRLLYSVAKELSGVVLVPPAWADEPPVDPPFLAPLLDDERSARLATYYVRILGDLAARCRTRGIALRLVYLGAGADPQTFEPAQQRALDLIATAATRSDLRYFDSRQEFAGCTDCFLAGDGHFSPAGHRRLAGYVAETVLAPP